MNATATQIARAVASALVELGTRHVVLCPGSRSAPLAFAWQALAEAGKVELHVRIDERAAAYLALGLAKATGTVVPVVTTSGTAVGNLMPAMMEAAHSGVPLLVLTADRPAAMLHTGANQTTDQAGLFDRFARASAQVGQDGVTAAVFQVGRLVTAALGVRTSDPGPVHLNLALSEPLTPDETPWPEVRPTQVETRVWNRWGYTPSKLTHELRTVVLVGDSTPEIGTRARSVAQAAGIPLFSEPSGNARRTPAISNYRLLLGTPLADKIERVLLFGHPTLSRPVSRLLARQDVEIIAVTNGARWVDPGCAVARVVNDVELTPGDPDWLATWVAADQDLALALAAEAQDLNGLGIAAAVWESAAHHQHRLVIGSSHPVRDLDLASVLPTAPVAYANRGLAGIDGTIATATGIALAHGPTTLLLGDLTFLHDAGALLIGPLERRPDLRVVVVNDDGGSIFHILEQGAPEHAATFERIFGTPTGAQLGQLAAGYGWNHRALATYADLRAALAKPITGPEILEVRIGRTDRRAQAARLAAAAGRISL